MRLLPGSVVLSIASKRLCAACYTVTLTVTLVLGVAGPAAAESTHNDGEREAIAYINAERVAAGVEPLAIYEDNQYAVEASIHYGTTGEAHGIIDRLRETGYNNPRVAENQGGTGCRYPESAAYGWRNSEEHNRIMLSPRYTHIAVAIVCTSRYADEDVRIVDDMTRNGATAHFMILESHEGEVIVADSVAEPHWMAGYGYEPDTEALAERQELLLAVAGTIAALIGLATLRGWLRQRRRRKAFRKNLERHPHDD